MGTSSDEAPAARWKELGRFLRRVPRQVRSRSVVSAILEAAEGSLDVAEHGPLDRLFARAGVAAGSFYEYFGSREALLAAVVQRVTDRNFETFLAEIDAAAAREESFEAVVREGAMRIARAYLQRPAQLRALARLSDRLGFLPVVERERDRFADAMADRAARFTPGMDPDARRAMMRAGADALVGVLLISAFRDRPPSPDEVGRAAGDAAWGVILVHLAVSRPR